MPNPIIGLCQQPDLGETAFDSLGGIRCLISRTCSSGTVLTDPTGPKSEKNENGLILLGRFKAA